MMGHRPRRPLRRGAYLLPSVFTVGNILLGWFAVHQGFQGRFRAAAILIFIAAVLDGLDGRIARMTGTESEFGKEFDALADALTFGAAPAVLAYFAALGDLGRIGLLVPPFYVVCAASRLARFNVNTKVVDKRWFVGMPAPAAACAVTALLLFYYDRGWAPELGGPLTAVLLLTGTLMVSTFRYPSFKQLDLRERRSYRMAILIAGSLLLAAYDPPLFFLAAGVLYTTWGPVSWLTGRARLRRRGEAKQPSPDRGLR